MGWTDVSINSQAMLCEKLGGKSTIGFFHAFYALGALFGALYGGLLLQINVSILNIFLYFAAIAIIPTITLRIWLFTKGEEKNINDNDEEKSCEIEIFMEMSSPIADEAQFEKMNDASLIGVFSANEEDEEKTSYERDSNATLASREANTSRNDEKSVKCAIEDGKSIDREFQDPSPWSRQLLSGGISIDSAESEGRNSNPGVTFVNPSSTKSQKGTNPIDYWVLFLLCSLGGLAYTGEGSIGDWSTVYLVIELKTSPIIGVLGFAVFQLIVCFGRYSSDTIVEYVDRKLLLQVSGGLASLGLGVVGLSQSLPTAYIVPCAIIGFGICGAGLSVVSPIVIYYAGTSLSMLLYQDLCLSLKCTCDVRPFRSLLCSI